MSNPVATIGNSIPEPPDPQVVRKTYTRIVYDKQQFVLYGPGEDASTFDPSNMGQSIYVAQRLGFSGLITQPSFVSDDTWTILKELTSVIVTAVNSVMPKIMVPSQVLVDNGPLSDEHTYEGSYFQGGWKDLFNWEGTQANSVAISDWGTEFFKYAYVAGVNGSLYLTTRHKDDLTAENSLVLNLNQPVSPPTGEWEESELVVNGAFVLMLNVVPTTSGADSPENANQKPWQVTVECGDIKLAIGEAGSLSATITSGENNTVTGNLAEGKAKAGPPQQKYIVDKEPYVIFVYPVWNGIVVASGGQDARGVIYTSSTFVPKWKEASIFVGYSDGFDPTNPDEVEVDVVSGGKDVRVDFGTEMVVTVANCRIDLAYLPCFFSTKAWFDEWFVASDDQPNTTYQYKVYPIWTANGTDYDLGSVSIQDSGIAGPVDNTTYRYVQWRLERADASKYLRWAGELFGSVLETTATSSFPIKNGNGNFDLQWTGGANPGNPDDSDWKHYVQSIQVTLDIDGSSGSITVDKYGVAGQSAVPVQVIGALTIAATGGYGTDDNGGTAFFQGLAMGVADSAAAATGTWTIPLIGLEKKMDDIALINVPFFDGETLNAACVFMSRYAGINLDMSHANPAVTLSISSDINTPRFDWKTGTSVKSAMDDIMTDTLHSYVVMDGKMVVYQLNDITGLPVSPGPDRSVGYVDTKTISRDQTPSFDNLRNDIVVMALEQVPQGKGTEIEEIPLFPMVERRTNVTVPDVPWAKAIFQPATGALTRPQLQNFADRIASKTRTYYEVGSLQIPGNATIRPYDMWGSYIIKSVSHNLDLSAKTWTTSMELIRMAS